MSATVLYTIITLSATGVLAAIIIYLAARKFKVFEDPRIDDINEALPGANCGGCGYAGCRNYAEALLKADDLSDLFCPVGGNDIMSIIAKILGKEAVEKEPMVAVVRCSGSFEHCPKINNYDSAATCIIINNLYSGDTGCQYGCSGLGDCVEVCNFDAIYMDKKTGLPVVIDDKCTACGACVEICPKDIIELRKKGKKGRRIFVSCINTEKGGIAKKSCAVACTGCTKCFKVCDKFEAIAIENSLAYIDFDKCKLCRKCVEECPTGAILEINFPPKKEKEEKEKENKQEELVIDKNITE